MTSPGLGELKRLINEAALKRIELGRDVRENREAVATAERRLALARAFIIRIFTASVVPKLTQRAEELTDKLDESRAQFDGCYVDIDFGLVHGGDKTGHWSVGDVLMGAV
jgi:hypothetical protein